MCVGNVKKEMYFWRWSHLFIKFTDMPTISICREWIKVWVIPGMHEQLVTKQLLILTQRMSYDLFNQITLLRQVTDLLQKFLLTNLQVAQIDLYQQL